MLYLQESQQMPHDLQKLGSLIRLRITRSANSPLYVKITVKGPIFLAACTPHHYESLVFGIINSVEMKES